MSRLLYVAKSSDGDERSLPAFDSKGEVRRFSSRSPLLLLLLILWTLTVFVSGASSADQSLREQIDGLAKPLVERGYTVGIAVALIEGDQTTILKYGSTSKTSGQEPDSRTVFEIGSVTKVFTTLALSDLVRSGQIKLEDPISALLPKSVSIPRYEEREITLLDLATHTSGLPRMPANFEPEDPYNPYAGYTAEKMYQFLATYKLPRAPGAQYEYSNLGSGLLGHVLSKLDGRNFETMISDRICKPLQMKDTSIEISPDQRSRLAQGYDFDLSPVPPWRFSALAGCGALHSTPDDMVKFLRAQMALDPTNLSTAMAATHTPRAPSAIPEWNIGLGWHLNADGQIGWHDGGTYGAYTFVGFDMKRRLGIVWLSNSALWQMPQLLSRLLDLISGKPVIPLELKGPISMDSAVLDQYAGRYKHTSDAAIKVSRDSARLMVEIPQRDPLYIYPESDTRFFVKQAPDIFFSFIKDQEGQVTKLTIQSPDGEKTAEKIK